MPEVAWKKPLHEIEAAEGLRGISALDAFRLLERDPHTVLLDVRTPAEWDFVGVPLVDHYLQVEWRIYPEMAINPDFLQEVKAAGIAPEQPLVVMCKMGGRSREAASFLVRNGFLQVYDMTDGFEGAPNDYGHRRCVNGWVAAGLPWLQC